VSPGTLTEEKFLAPDEHNYLTSVNRGSRGALGLAWLELSTGEFQMCTSECKFIVVCGSVFKDCFSRVFGDGFSEN